MTQHEPRPRAETFKGIVHWPARRETVAFLLLYVLAFGPSLLLSALHAGQVGLLGFPWWVILYCAWNVYQHVTKRVTVGADGLWLHGWPYARFVPWSTVSALHEGEKPDIRPQTTRFDVVLRSGEVIAIRSSVRPDALEALLGRARAFLHAFHQRTPGAVAAVLPLARAGRNAGDWLRGLRAITHGGQDYRSSAVADEALWAIVEDPGADASSRAGAAAALAATRDHATRARIRIAAEASASPVLQEALVRISEADADAGVENALGHVRDSAASS